LEGKDKIPLLQKEDNNKTIELGRNQNIPLIVSTHHTNEREINVYNQPQVGSGVSLISKHLGEFLNTRKTLNSVYILCVMHLNSLYVLKNHLG
jgi:hypothetical protein